MVAIEQLSDIFSKVAANLHQKVDPPQQQPVTRSTIIPQKVRPTLTKPIPSELPNIMEYYDGNSPTIFQQNVHMSPSGPHIILPDVPVPPPRVRPAQPPKWTREVQAPTIDPVERKILSPTLHWQHNSSKLESQYSYPSNIWSCPEI